MVAGFLTRFRSLLLPHTIRLTFIFLAIIMCMSLVFSGALYSSAASQLERQLPGNGFVDIDGLFEPSMRVQQYLANNIRNGEREIITRLVILNVITFLIGLVVSFLLARQTLKPIEDSMLAQFQFVSDASHELKTPLTAIQTMNEVTLRKKKLTLREAKATIQSNIDDVKRMYRLTRMLLELANQDSTLETAPTSVHEIVSIALTNSATNAGIKQVSIDDRTKPLSVMANAVVAGQALTAVIDNAIKYSGEGSEITLATKWRRNSVQIIVSDNGPGISKADLTRIFDRFYRSDPARSRKQYDGYGLGLALVKKIMTLHGGSVRATSEPGKGSSFILSFPVAKHAPKYQSV